MSGVDVLFHQAAIRITQCAEEPRLALEVLVDGTFNVIEAAVDAGVARSVVASSASVYGLAERVPHHRAAPPVRQPDALRRGEDVQRGPAPQLRTTWPASTTWRCATSTSTGPRMDIFGVYTEVLVRWMERIEAGRAPAHPGRRHARPWTSSTSTTWPGPTSPRPTAPVTDEVFNVASGTETSLRGLADALLRVMGSDLEPEHGPERAVNPVARRLADTSAAAERLGLRRRRSTSTRGCAASSTGGRPSGPATVDVTTVDGPGRRPRPAPGAGDPGHAPLAGRRTRPTRPQPPSCRAGWPRGRASPSSRPPSPGGSTPRTRWPCRRARRRCTWRWCSRASAPVTRWSCRPSRSSPPPTSCATSAPPRCSPTSTPPPRTSPPTTVAAALTAATRAVILVDQAGIPADIDGVRGAVRPAGHHGRAGRGLRGRRHLVRAEPVGARAELAAFSFHPRKIITTGEGGMLVIADGDRAARARRLREHGMSVERRRAARQPGAPVLEQYLETGFNHRMTDIQAAVGLVQLEQARRDRRPAADPRGPLPAPARPRSRGLAGATMAGDPPGGTTNYQSFWVCLPDGFPVGRDELLGVLAARGVSARRGIMAAHLEPAYADVSPSRPAGDRAADPPLADPARCSTRWPRPTRTTWSTCWTRRPGGRRDAGAGPAAGPADGERDRPLLRLRGVPAPLRRQRARPARRGRPRARHRRLLDRRHACGGGPPAPSPTRRVEVRRHPVNRGHIATYNEGLAWADGDYVALVSADDMVTPGAFARATTIMRQRPGRGPRLRAAAPRAVRPAVPTPDRAVAGDHVLGRPALDRPALPHGLQLHLVARGGRAHVGAPRRRRLRARAARTRATSSCGCASPRCPTSPTCGGCRRRSTGCTPAACCAAATPTRSSTCATARLHSTRSSPRCGVGPSAARPQRAVGRALARQALWQASRAVDRGRLDEVDVAALVAFADEASPDARRLPQWHGLPGAAGARRRPLAVVPAAAASAGPPTAPATRSATCAGSCRGSDAVKTAVIDPAPRARGRRPPARPPCGPG